MTANSSKPIKWEHANGGVRWQPRTPDSVRAGPPDGEYAYWGIFNTRTWGGAESKYPNVCVRYYRSRRYAQWLGNRRRKGTLRATYVKQEDTL